MGPNRTRIFSAYAPLLVLLGAGFWGCGGAEITPESNLAPPAQHQTAEGLTRENPSQMCHVHGTDYQFVADFQCADGSTPLGGDPQQGGAARIGNVGQGADGHVIDHYQVPCTPTPVDLWVDAYHCPDGVEVEPNFESLTDEQLGFLRRNALALESAPFHPEATDARQSILQVMMETQEFSITLCQGMLGAFPDGGYEHAGLVRAQFVVSLGAAVIGRGDGPEDRIRENTEAMAGVVRMYERMVEQQGPPASHALMDAIFDHARAGTLEDHVTTLVADCGGDPEPAGFQVTVDGRAVWPPSGPQCDAFVACCESNGLVQNGTAVPGNAGGLLCLLQASSDPVDCAGGLQSLAESGIVCRAPGSSAP